jgi:hypothetical protein
MSALLGALAVLSDSLAVKLAAEYQREAERRAAYVQPKEVSVEPGATPVAPARVRHRSGNGYRPGPDRRRRRSAHPEGNRLS